MTTPPASRAPKLHIRAHVLWVGQTNTVQPSLDYPAHTICPGNTTKALVTALAILRAPPIHPSLPLPTPIPGHPAAFPVTPALLTSFFPDSLLEVPSRPASPPRARTQTSQTTLPAEVPGIVDQRTAAPALLVSNSCPAEASYVAAVSTSPPKLAVASPAAAAARTAGARARRECQPSSKKHAHGSKQSKAQTRK